VLPTPPTALDHSSDNPENSHDPLDQSIGMGSKNIMGSLA
jgi:hypothetical protein